MSCRGCGTSPLPVIDWRGFLACCAGCAGAAVLGGGLGLGPSHGGRAGARRKPRVRLVFCEVANTQPIWPNIGYDFAARREELSRALRDGCPDVEFLPEVVTTPEETDALLTRSDEVDGYLVYVLGLSWRGNPQKICMAGRPTLLVDDPFGGSGEFMTQLPRVHAAGVPTEWVSSTRVEDVIASARCFGVLSREGATPEAFVRACREARRARTPGWSGAACAPDLIRPRDFDETVERLGETRILVVGGGQDDALRDAARALLGVRLMPISFEEAQAAYERADRGEAVEFAERWMSEAAEVVEPARGDVEDAGAMYVAMRALLGAHGATGISINCLGGFYGGHLGAYPCLGFCQLNNDGMVGGCEADQHAALTMMLGSTLFGRPGYISDPVFDTSKNEVVYAHCVAPTRVFGPDGPVNPYRLRSHSEDRMGASIQSMPPAGYMTTTMMLDPQGRRLLMHRGRSVENVESEMACRTKLGVELLGDIEKLATEWRMGWHRVTFYGDLREPVLAFADRIGLEVIEEA